MKLIFNVFKRQYLFVPESMLPSGGEVHVRWAYGAWTDRASLYYSHELNQPMDINT